MTTPSEHAEQVALCRWLDKRGIVYFAVPNAARRNWRTASRLRAEGMRAGAPDLVVAMPGRPVAIEMKRRLGGKLSQSQAIMLADLAAVGWGVIVAHGALDAIEQLEGYGVL